MKDKLTLISAIVALALSILTLAFQFGFLNARLDQIEQATASAEKLTSRISHLEGKIEMITTLFEEFRRLQGEVRAVQREIGLTPPATGRIISPSQDAGVSRDFVYEVEINNPVPRRFYYLAHEVNDEYWPKTRVTLLPNESRAKGIINEGGSPPNGIFHIVLFEVTAEEHQRIKNWFKNPDLPGIQIDGYQIDRIRVKLQ